jgi:hypothetical protein
MAYEEMMIERYKTIRVKYVFDQLYVIVVAKKHRRGVEKQEQDPTSKTSHPCSYLCSYASNSASLSGPKVVSTCFSRMGK